MVVQSSTRAIYFPMCLRVSLPRAILGSVSARSSSACGRQGRTVGLQLLHLDPKSGPASTEARGNSEAGLQAVGVRAMLLKARY